MLAAANPVGRRCRFALAFMRHAARSPILFPRCCVVPPPAGCAGFHGARIRRRELEDEKVPEQQSERGGHSEDASMGEGRHDSVREDVRLALEAALSSGSGASQAEVRLSAVAMLRELASPPDVADGAEDALHQILLVANAPELSRAADEALWSVWHLSGNDEVDAALRRGMALMDHEHFEEAVSAFTEVVQMAPGFAEGWNKRATARFLLQDFYRCIEDSEMTLKLKPRHFGCLTGLGMCHKERGDHEEAIKWLRAALQVNPGLSAARHIVHASELQTSLSKRLRPRIVRLAQALNDGKEVPLEADAELACSWDAWLVEGGKSGVEEMQDEQEGFSLGGTAKSDGQACTSSTYFLRVRIRNKAAVNVKLRSLARFYVFRLADGHILPITRVTEGATSFTLHPGEEHRLSWLLAMHRELRSAGGGVLFVRDGEEACVGEVVDSSRAMDYVEADLGLVTPSQDAASTDEIERLGLGYLYTGHLDLRRLELPGLAPIANK